LRPVGAWVTMKDMGAQDADNQPFISGFVDNRRKVWLIDREASIGEIEEHTDIQYHKIDSEKDAIELHEIIKQLEDIGKNINDKETLIKAANALAVFVLRCVRYNTEEIAAMVRPSEPSAYISLGQLFVEIASLYLIYFDKISIRFFGKEKSDVFYDRFLDNFIALAAIENYGTRAYDMQSALVSGLNERIKEYSR
jgi:hypothetical protein